MTRLLFRIRLSFFSWVSVLVLLIGASAPAQADIITQTATITQTNPNYLYFNAEDFDRLEFPAGNPSWQVNFNPGAGSVSGKTLMSQTSGNDNGGGNDSFAIFKLDFTDPGDYTFYAYHLRTGGGDSMFPPPDFGVVPFHDPTFGESVNRWNEIDNNAWNELGVHGNSPGVGYYASGVVGAYTVGAAGLKEFTIEAREDEAQYDRFVLHKTKGLSAGQLDALTFSDATVVDPIVPPPPPPPPPLRLMETQTFNSEASAIAAGWTEFQSRDGVADYGFSNTNNAGAAAGEAGGVVARIAPISYYGDVTLGGALSHDDNLSATGRLYFDNSHDGDGHSFDGEFHIGWFDKTNAESDGKDFLGIFFQEPGGDGNWRVRATIDGTNGPIMPLPDKTVLDFEIAYDGITKTNTVTFTDGVTVWVSEVTSDQSAVLDAFGMLSNNQTRGDHGKLFLDDLSYTAFVVIPEPSTFVLAALGLLGLLGWGRRRRRT